MTNYKTILIAVALEGGAEDVLSRATDVVKQNTVNGSAPRVILLNACYFPMPVAFFGNYAEGYFAPTDVPIDQKSVQAEVLPQLDELVAKFDIKVDDTIVDFERPVDSVLNTAAEESVDLIVMGSHARHGLGLLLGSTANGVLHRADCDVLSVRIKDKKLL